MTDIVERLRRWHIVTADQLHQDAADEIERLRHRLEGCKQAYQWLEQIVEKAEAKLAALNLCDPHFLDRKLRELEHERERANAAETLVSELQDLLEKQKS